MATGDNVVAAPAARHAQGRHADVAADHGRTEDAQFPAAAARQHLPQRAAGPATDAEVAQLPTTATTGAEHPQVQPAANGGLHKAANGQVPGQPARHASAGPAPGAASGHARSSRYAEPPAEPESHAGSCPATCPVPAAARPRQPEQPESNHEHDEPRPQPQPAGHQPPVPGSADQEAAHPTTTAAATAGCWYGCRHGGSYPVPATARTSVPTSHATTTHAATYADGANQPVGADEPASGRGGSHHPADVAAAHPPAAADEATDELVSTAQPHEPPAAHALRTAAAFSPAEPADRHFPQQPGAIATAGALPTAPVPASTFQPFAQDTTAAFPSPHLATDRLPAPWTGSIPG